MSSEKPWFEALVACLPDGVALVAENWTIVWANRRLGHLLGRDVALGGLALEQFVDDFAAVREGLLYRLERETRADVPVVVRAADGSRFPCTLYAARCPVGAPARWSVCLRDATESEDLRRRIAERERSHSFLKSVTSDLIVRTDADFRVLWANEAAESLFPSGTPLPARLNEPSRAAIADGASREDGEAVRRDIAIESADGAIPYFALRGAMRRLVGEDGAFAGISLILRDDSDARRLARLARRLALSPREEEVVGYLVQGYTNLNIASILGISESGVKFHVRNVFARAQVSSRTELMATYLGDAASR